MLVALLIQDGKLEEAGKELAAMKKVAPRHPQTFFLQALLAFREGNLAAARDAVQLHLKAAPNSLRGLLLGAQIDYRLGCLRRRSRRCSRPYSRACRINQLARSLLVQTYLRQGKPARALEVLKPMLQDEKLDSDRLALAGEVYIQNGDAATAAQYFEKAAALDPKNTGKRTAVALSHLAKGERDRGLEELQAVAGEDTGIRADLALVATNMQQKKFDAALAAVAAIEKKQPDKPLAHNLRGGVLLAKGDVAGARRSFERALEIDPAYLPAATNLARLDMRDKKPDDAKKRFEAVVAKDPKNSKALPRPRRPSCAAGGSPDEVAALIGKAVGGESDGRGGAARADLPLDAQRTPRRRSLRRRTRSPQCRTGPRSWMPPARRTVPRATPIRPSRRTTSWPSCVQIRRCRTCGSRRSRSRRATARRRPKI